MNVALRADPARSRRRARRPAVDRRRLSADARLADPRRRLARGHLRRGAHVRDSASRRSGSRRRSAPLAPNANTLIVFRGMQGIAGALLTPASLAADHVDVLGRRARRRDRHVDCVERHLDRRRAAARRLADRRLELARDLPPERADRARHARARADAAAPAPARARRACASTSSAASSASPGSARSCFGFIEQPRRGWGDAGRSPAALAGGAALLAAFVVWECAYRAADAAAAPLPHAQLRVANIETFAVYGGLSAWVVLPRRSSCSRSPGYSPFRAGLATLPVTIVMFVLSRYAGRFSMRFGPRLFMARGPADRGRVDHSRSRGCRRIRTTGATCCRRSLGFALGAHADGRAADDDGALATPGPAMPASRPASTTRSRASPGLVAIAVVGIAAASGSGPSDGAQGFHRGDADHRGCSSARRRRRSAPSGSATRRTRTSELAAVRREVLVVGRAGASVRPSPSRRARTRARARRPRPPCPAGRSRDPRTPSRSPAITRAALDVRVLDRVDVDRLAVRVHRPVLRARRDGEAAVERRRVVGSGRARVAAVEDVDRPHRAGSGSARRRASGRRRRRRLVTRAFTIELSRCAACRRSRRSAGARGAAATGRPGSRDAMNTAGRPPSRARFAPRTAAEWRGPQPYAR